MRCRDLRQIVTQAVYVENALELTLAGPRGVKENGFIHSDSPGRISDVGCAFVDLASASMICISNGDIKMRIVLGIRAHTYHYYFYSLCQFIKPDSLVA